MAASITNSLSGSLPQGSLHPRRIGAHLRRTSIQRRGRLNHNWTAGGLSTRLWSRATEPPRRVSQWNHMIKPALFERAGGSWRTGT